MSSKKKSTTTYDRTTTSAPPSWTMPGISDVSKRVTDALDTLPGERYTGDFVARPDQGMIDQIGNIWGATGDNAAKYADIIRNDAMGLGGPIDFGNRESFGGDLGLPTRPDLDARTPNIAPANPFTSFDVQSRPDLWSKAPVIGNAPAFKSAEIMDIPDIQSYLSTADKPQFVRFDPREFTPDDGGARLQAAMEAAQQPVFRQLTQQVLPSLRSSAIDAGAYTGGRAMNIEPGRALAEAATRANEITQGLAYEGYQSQEERDLKAWQADQALRGEMAGMENEFNTNIFDAILGQRAQGLNAAMTGYGIRQGALSGAAEMENRFNESTYGTRTNAEADLFRTLAGAEMEGYGTEMGALADRARMANEYAMGNREMDIGSAMDIFKTLTNADVSMYGTDVGAAVDRGRLMNEAYGLETERGLGTNEAARLDAGARSGLFNDSLGIQASQGDLLRQFLELQTGADQTGISNDLARDQYNLEYPFRGLDIATNLLTQLSGGWGTQHLDGTDSTVEKTGGLGEIVKGVAGLGMAGASLFGGGGPLGSALGAAKPASSLFNFSRNFNLDNAMAGV